jgi:RNA polymerase sigma-70 factor (ECF subfamily)
VDDRELVERAGRGDREAFSALLRPRLPRLDAAARLILRDPELAGDAVQDAALVAWRDVPGLRDPDRFDAWLHRVVVRSCLLTLRRRRRRVVEVELTTESGLPTSDIGIAVADRDQVDRALRRLTADTRAVVVVHFYFGLPLTDVAEVLEIPVGTAKSRLHRALETMRLELGGSAVSVAGSVAPGASA